MDCAERENGYTISAIRDKARRHRTTICATIFGEQGPGVYFDTAFFIAPDGETLGKYRKTHPAAVQTLETIYLCGGSRFPVAKVRGFAVGAVICCDHCFPEAVRCCAVNGTEMVFGGRSHIGFDPSGEILATASSESDDTIVAELSRVRVYPAPRRWPMLRDRRPEVYGR